MKMRKVFGFFLAFVLVLSSVKTALAFDDVNDAADYGVAVNYLIDVGVLEDDGDFYPNRPMGRAEFIMWALKNQSFNPAGYEHKFYFWDVPFASEYAPYVSRAIDLGAITKSSDYFAPMGSLTRVEALEILLKLEGITIPLADNDGADFKDVKTVEDKAVVNKALDLSLIDPLQEDFFGAQTAITRADAAELLYKVALMSLSQWNDAMDDYYDVSGGTTIVISSNPDLNMLESVWDTILSDYYGANDLSKQEMLYSAIEGLVQGLGDIHSTFQRPDVSDSFGDQLAGEFEGIGAYVDVNEDGEPYILAPMVGSPAEEAGVKAGDVVLKIDGESIEGKTIYDVVRLMKGPAGTQVKVLFRRGSSEVELTITRAKVEFPVVSLEMQGKTAVFKIAEFTDTLASKFADLADEAKEQGANAVVLDLRNNPGGYLDAAQAVLGYFEEEDSEIFSIKFSDDSEIDYHSEGPGYFKNMPVAILLNEASASASEVVSLTLKEENGAKIVGAKSYGKGSAQKLYPFLDGSNLKLTVAHWFSADGTSIEGIGISPDYKIEDDEDTQADEVLEKAMTVLWN